ncbi:ATP-dependent RNA helicase, putative [Anopheles sinensis]|uniref:ATP-dependent RNA helicase, putative n=1 Tax=Anopheles sinensis TaxID=74873 RepID=A0A084W8H7_ANOSI|nr:ATP-dependent RNA helicase, putative [Anopheles sinensis]
MQMHRIRIRSPHRPGSVPRNGLILIPPANNRLDRRRATSAIVCSSMLLDVAPCVLLSPVSLCRIRLSEAVSVAVRPKTRRTRILGDPYGGNRKRRFAPVFRMRSHVPHSGDTETDDRGAQSPIAQWCSRAAFQQKSGSV